MKRKLNILITNDDGIDAEGIRHLWMYLKEIANLFLFAPAKNQTAVGLSITLREPLQMKKLFWEEGTVVYSISGTPADCVKLALAKHFHSFTPDLVVSGINQGTNAGRNLLYSGTVAGAIEAVMHNIPAIAFSCHDNFCPDYTITQPYILKIVEHVLKHPLPQGTLLNVNFPDCQGGKPHGMKLTRQGKEHWAENFEERLHPSTQTSYYWLGAKLAKYEEQEDCDVSWLQKGYVACVPIHVHELTDFGHLEAHRELFENF